jgi:hypothetical protein
VAPADRIAQLGQPTAAPHPHPVHGVDESAQGDLGHQEAGEADPLGDGADDDVGGGLHEHDLEQEERQHADVIGVAALQEEPVQADDPGRAVPEDSVEGRGVPEVRDRRHAAELERKPDGVIHQQRHRERRDVHHHHMTSVFRSGQSGDQEREADLHEQDQKPGNEQPREVDRHPQVPGLVRQLVDPNLRDGHVLARRRQVVVDAALGRRRIRRRLGATRVPGAAVPKLAHRHQRDEHEQRQRKELLAPRHRYPLSKSPPHPVGIL